MALPRGVEFFPILNTFAATTRRGGGQNVLTPEAPPVIIPTPTEPGMPTPQLPPEEPKHVGRRRLLATLGGVALGGAIETTPARYLVNPYFERLLQGLGLMETPIPFSFDNKAEKGFIGDNNILTLPLSEIQKEFPQQVIEKDHTLTFLFPFIPPDGSRVQYEKSLGLPPLVDPKLVPPEDRQQQEEGVRRRKEAEKAGIKTTIDFILPKDTVIVAPVGGHVFVRKGQSAWRENPTKSPDARIFYYDENHNTTYVFWFVALDLSTGKTNFDPLIPTQEDIIWHEENWKNLPTIQQGKHMLKATTDNQVVRMKISAYKGQQVGGKAEFVDRTLFFVTPQFLTTTEEGGLEKMVVVKD